MYHGASRKTHSDTVNYEERPLFFLIAEEGIYFSSMPTSLFAIRDNESQEVKILQYNIVVKVTSGEFTNDRVEINRSESNLEPVRAIPVHTPTNTNNTYIPSRTNNAYVQTRIPLGGKGEESLKTPKNSLVLFETIPKKALSVKDERIIYFHKGRYYSTGGSLCNHLMWIKDRGVITEDTDRSATAYWFYQGVMLKDLKSYETLIEETNAKDSWASSTETNFAYCISRFSAFPVTNMESEALSFDDFFKFSWYFDGRRITTKITPKYSGRCYNIVNGFLENIISSNPDDKITIATATDADLYGVCETGGCGSEIVEESESNFDIVFQSEEELYKIVSKIEFEALLRLLAENLKIEWQTNPLYPEIQAAFYTKVKTAVSSNLTLRQVFGDKHHVLDSIVNLIKSEEEEEVDPIQPIINAHVGVTRPRIFQDVSTEYEDDLSDDDRWASIYGYHINTIRNVSVDAETSPFPNDEESEIDVDDIDMIIEAHEKSLNLKKLNEEHEKEELFQQSGQKIDEVVNGLSELVTISEELESINSDYAQDACAILKVGLGDLKYKLSSVCETHNDPESLRKITQEIIL